MLRETSLLCSKVSGVTAKASQKHKGVVLTSCFLLLQEALIASQAQPKIRRPSYCLGTIIENNAIISIFVVCVHNL